MVELYLFRAFLIVVNDKLISDFVSWVIDDYSDGRDILIFVQNVVLWYLLKMLQLMIKYAHFFCSSINEFETKNNWCFEETITVLVTQVLWMRHWRLCHRRWSWRWESLQGRSSSLLCWRWWVKTYYITIRHGFVCLFVCKEGAALLALVSSNAQWRVSSFTSAYKP